MEWLVARVEPTPRIKTPGWRLEIDGLVDKPVVSQMPGRAAACE
jgi:DMSO/TMAO reductase YedYZ molybdopterin-dependent catalytic subunit